MITPTVITTNLWLASFAVLRGVEVVDVMPSDAATNSALVLDDTDGKARQIAYEFWSGDPQVSLKSLANARGYLVRRINQLRQSSTVKGAA